MEKITEATGLNAQQISKYGLYLGVVLVMFGIAGPYITCLLGVAYPAFMSFLALESDGADDDKQWLTYWVVFGMFNILDHFSGWILAFIPFYFFLKLAFLVFLFHPDTKGATTIYNKYILPSVEDYDAKLRELEQNVKNLGGEVMNKIDEAKEAVTGTKED